MTTGSVTAFDLCRAACFSGLLNITEGDDSDEAHIVRARAYLHLDCCEAVLEELKAIDGTVGDLAATAGALRHRAYGRLRNSPAVDECPLKVETLYEDITAIGRSELAIARSIISKQRGRPDEMQRAAEQIEGKMPACGIGRGNSIFWHGSPPIAVDSPRVRRDFSDSSVTPSIRPPQPT